MLVFNYIITPFYMGMPREAILKMLLPVFLPFNTIKCLLNSALAMLLYKPFVQVLRRRGMLESGTGNTKRNSIESFIAAFVLIIMCMLAIIILRASGK